MEQSQINKRMAGIILGGLERSPIMWLCTSSAFLSVVADRNNKNLLLVRARVAGHIETVFPKAEVFTNDGADYLYRALISRAEVGRAISAEVRGIDYDNFKRSVTNQALHDCYLGFWSLMHKLQNSLRTTKTT
jgi:hypothetical protein